MILAQLDSPFLDRIALSLGVHGYELKSFLAILLVSLTCGMVSALVVGNRMAFFGDAMAHCSFAGVALAMLLLLFMGVIQNQEDYYWIIPLIMVVFGSVVGMGISFVRENTNLASDTVIGVFFAATIGFAAMLLTALERYKAFSPEMFLFGSPLFVQSIDLLYLTILLFVVSIFLIWQYNQLVLGSFNTSLARSRKVALRRNNYLFIVLLALIVNLSIVAVGALLINAMLIVPAAAASNLARNLRQMFWYTILISLGVGLIGLQLSRLIVVRLNSQETLQFGPSGMIICLSVLCFFLSMAVPPFRRFLATPVRKRSMARSKNRFAG